MSEPIQTAMVLVLKRQKNTIILGRWCAYLHTYQENHFFKCLERLWPVSLLFQLLLTFSLYWCTIRKIKSDGQFKNPNILLTWTHWFLIINIVIYIYNEKHWIKPKNKQWKILPHLHVTDVLKVVTCSSSTWVKKRNKVEYETVYSNSSKLTH